MLGVQQFLLAAEQFFPASLMFALFSILKSTERGSRSQEFRRIGQKRAASRTFPLSVPLHHRPVPIAPCLLIQINIHHGK